MINDIGDTSTVSRISVVKVITDGNRGFPYDRIVQIGAVDADTETRIISGEMLITVRSDIDSWTQAQREHVGDSVSEDDIRNGTPLRDAVQAVKDRLRGRDSTSFEISNTFGRYLSFEPWDLTQETSILPSVSFRLPSTVRGMDTSKENMFIDRAYRKYLDDPLGLSDRKRDALDYAKETAMILFHLRDRGYY